MKIKRFKLPTGVNFRFRDPDRKNKGKSYGKNGTGYTYNDFITSQRCLSKSKVDKVAFLIDAGFSIAQIYIDSINKFSLRDIYKSKRVSADNFRREDFTVAAINAAGFDYYTMINFSDFTAENYITSFGVVFIAVYFPIKTVDWLINTLFNPLTWLGVKQSLTGYYYLYPRLPTPPQIIASFEFFMAIQAALWMYGYILVMQKLNGKTLKSGTTSFLIGDYNIGNSYLFNNGAKINCSKVSISKINTSIKIDTPTQETRDGWYSITPIVKTDIDTVNNTTNNPSTFTSTTTTATNINSDSTTSSQYKNPELRPEPSNDTADQTEIDPTLFDVSLEDQPADAETVGFKRLTQEEQNAQAREKESQR